MEDQIIKQRKEKLDKIRQMGINPYPYKFIKSKHNNQIKESYTSIKPEQFSEQTESVAGRIMQKREMGKIAFLTIRDEFTDLQIVLKRDLTQNFKLLKLLDIGDFIGVIGKVGRTKKGEISIFAEELKILSKSIRPLPEKFHGIKDDETRYRKRYLDLIMNLTTREDFKIRHQIIKETRQYLYNKDFIEVETPILQSVYGGANARPFTTHHNALDFDFFLKISPELFLKRLIVGGYERVFEITKCFRNEGYDTKHSPEFTMIEWYMAYADYNDMMNMIEELFQKITLKIKGNLKFEYQGIELDFSKFKRITMIDAIKEIGGYDVENMTNNEIIEALKKYDVVVENKEKSILINELFEATVEEKLIQPTFIMDYPVEVSPLTKIHRNKPGFVERFELFIAGREISNAYSELNDPIDQRKRFEEQEKMRQQGDEEAMPNDFDFVEAIETGMPPTGGLGFGIDRLVMLMTNTDSIKDVILFPAMKPENEEENEEIQK